MAKNKSNTTSVRKIIIEEHRQIPPFNDRARNLNILNQPLWLAQREAIETTLDKENIQCTEAPHAQSLDDIRAEDDTPTLIHNEDLFFDNAYFDAFWEQAKQQARPCQAAFSADDEAFVRYAIPLTDRVKIKADHDTNGNPIHRVPLYYLPKGVPVEGLANTHFDPLIVGSNYRELGYYSVPTYMASGIGYLTHLLPHRSMLSIESWVHIYYANVIFGVFALGSRLETRMNKNWWLRLKTLAQAMMEQKQVLSCSKLVTVGRDCQIDPNAVLQNRVVIGDNVTIEAGAVIVNSIIGDNVTIGQDSHVFLSTIGEGCFLPFKASLFMSVFMEHAIVAQNTCLQMAVVGRNSFIGAGNTFTDFMMIPKSGGETLRAMGPLGLEPTGQVVLGGCVGHNCRIGSGMVVYPARMVESDVVLFASPERRVIMRNVTYEESDHHKLPRAELHQRLYPRADEEEDEEDTW
jgi:carbonic anhydrase/acetyltransferase-like protein (isoleucine patch superfamily)